MIPIVKAETCDNHYISNFAGNYKNQSLSLGTNTIDLTLPNVINLGTNYDYYYIYLYNAITSTSQTNYSSINYTSTCTNQTNYYGTPTNRPYIQYMDGTTATLYNWQELYNLCTEYSNSGTITSPISYEPSISNINVLLRNSNTGDQVICDYNKDNSIAKCPKMGEFNTIRFWVTLEKSNTSNFKVGVLSGSVRRCTSDTTSIINNNNSNTQQVINNQNNINNSITSNDVTGNNSNSSITSIGNTFSSQEDFLLNLLTIPYTLWSSILNVFSNTCAPLDVGTVFNYHLVFPCIELNQFLGGIYATIIDVIFTAIIYSAFIRRVMKYFRELLTLDDHALITGGVKLW